MFVWIWFIWFILLILYGRDIIDLKLIYVLSLVTDAPRWDQAYDDDLNSDGSGYGCGDDFTTKCFAQAALTNSLRIRSSVTLQKSSSVSVNKINNWKALRCKY